MRVEGRGALISVLMLSGCGAAEVPARPPASVPLVAVNPPPAVVRPVLPGVRRVSFGVAERTKNAAGTEICWIAQPLPDPPVFDGVVSEITYVVELEPRTVKSAATRVVAPPGQGALEGAVCNGFTIIRGGFSQTQLGNTISRVDQQPLMPGSYTLQITVDGQTAEVPFTIK
jgi:hypothetical protein